MSGGDIAGLIAAGVFLVLVLLLAVPLLKLGGVLDEVRSGIRESVDAITPTLAETQVTVLEANKQLAKIDSITTHVSETTSNVSSLVALTAAIAAGVAVWMWREPRRLSVLSLALIIGGALGNGVDRAVYGAVVDFVHFHWGSFSWYIFNIADVAIVVGVIGLLYESFRPSGEKTA